GNCGGGVTALRTQGSRDLPSAGSLGGFAAAKAAGTKIVMVTAYDAWSARILADAPVDCLLVGDSAMMVVHGEKDTLGATPELMVMHTRAVARGAPGKFIVADMPFLAARKGEAHALDLHGVGPRPQQHRRAVEGVRLAL